jgi:hypothetical protein
MKSCGGWTRLSSGPGQGTSDLEVMSSSPDSAEFHTKLVFLTCFRTCGVNEPEELRQAELETSYWPEKNIRSYYTTILGHFFITFRATHSVRVSLLSLIELAR